jgi:hypothetical protein
MKSAALTSGSFHALVADYGSGPSHTLNHTSLQFRSAERTVCLLQALGISRITVSDIMVEMNYTPPFKNFALPSYFSRNMANKQLLELVRMRVRYNDINNETLLL